MAQIVILKVDMCIDETIIGEHIQEESHGGSFHGRIWVNKL